MIFTKIFIYAMSNCSEWSWIFFIFCLKIIYPWSTLHYAKFDVLVLYVNRFQFFFFFFCCIRAVVLGPAITNYCVKWQYLYPGQAAKFYGGTSCKPLFLSLWIYSNNFYYYLCEIFHISHDLFKWINHMKVTIL